MGGSLTMDMYIAQLNRIGFRERWESMVGHINKDEETIREILCKD